MSVKYTYDQHLITKQLEAEATMLEELAAGNYTLENPLIKYDAYLTNPLSAVICFDTEEEVAVTISVKGKKPQGTITHTFPKAKQHVLPVLGLYANYNNQVEISLYRGASHMVEIMVPDIFAGKELVYSMDTTPEYLQDNMIIVSPAGEYFAMAVDYAGDIRWYLSIPCVFDVKRLRNGNIIMGSHRILQKPYYVSGLYEMSMVGKVYKEFRVPGGYHHDQWEMEDGNILTLNQDLTSDTVEDTCVLLDRETGEVLKTWDFKESFARVFGEDFHTKGIGQSGSWSHEDWFHNNALWYDKNTDSITLSGRHMDAIINIDYESGDLKWIISDPTGWPEELHEKMKPYFFTSVGNNFGWQYEQHACLVTPNGDIMCFDNHHYGAKKADVDHQLLSKDNYSRGVRFKINTEDMTIEQVWEYGKDRGAEFFSPYISNVEYYNEGHYLVHSGGVAYDKFGVPSEALGAFIKKDGGTNDTYTVEICDNKKMLELHMEGNFYRAEKMKLYAPENNLTLGAGKVLGEMGLTKEFDTEIPLEPCGELIPERYMARVVEEDDRLTFYSTFEKGQLVMLLLEKEDEVHRYYISTTAIAFLAMCCATFMDLDERKTRTAINKVGMNGTYDLRLIIDDKKYETGIQITC